MSGALLTTGILAGAGEGLSKAASIAQAGQIQSYLQDKRDEMDNKRLEQTQRFALEQAAQTEANAMAREKRGVQENRGLLQQKQGGDIILQSVKDQSDNARHNEDMAQRTQQHKDTMAAQTAHFNAQTAREKRADKADRDSVAQVLADEQGNQFSLTKFGTLKPLEVAPGKPLKGAKDISRGTEAIIKGNSGMIEHYQGELVRNGQMMSPGERAMIERKMDDLSKENHELTGKPYVKPGGPRPFVVGPKLNKLGVTASSLGGGEAPPLPGEP